MCVCLFRPEFAFEKEPARYETYKATNYYFA